MKRLSCLLLTLALCARTLAADPAPLTLTVKSFRALTNHIAKIVETASPGNAEEALSGLREGLGISELKGIDLDRPWQVAIWADGSPGQPAISVWVPTSNFETFKSGLDDGALKGEGNVIREAGNYAGIWIAGAEESKEAEAAHAAWKPEMLKSGENALLLEVQPGETLRNKLLQGLAGIRMMIIGVAAGQQAQMMPGVDAKALGELMGVYFDVIEVVLKGLEKLDLGVDLKAETLVIRPIVRAKTGTDLASWFKMGEGSLDSVMPYAAGPAPLVFAMRADQNPGFMPTMKKFMRLSMQMQGTAADSDAIKETDKLMDIMFPLKMGGNAEFGKGFTFSGVYQFPGRDAGEVYKAMGNYFQKSMQSQAGEGKPYKSVTYETGKRTVGGVKVDRGTMVFNFESPLYKMPGQKETIESLWPGGKMEFDYALKGENMFVASPAQMDGLLTGKPSGKTAAVNKNTVVYGRMNILKLIPMVLGSNPMVPDEVKDKFKALESDGTELTLRLDMDGSMAGEVGVPLKFIGALGKLDQ